MLALVLIFIRNALGSKLMSEAEVIVLGYLSQESAKKLWENYIQNSRLREMPLESRDALFQSVHEVCRGNIADMMRLFSNIEKQPSVDFEAALQRTIIAPNVISRPVFDLYDKTEKLLSPEEISQLALLNILMNTTDSFVSTSGFSAELLEAMKSLLEENVLSVCYDIPLSYNDDGQNTCPQQSHGPFPVITFSSVFTRLRIEQKLTEILELEQKRLTEILELEKKRLEEKFRFTPFREKVAS